MLQSKKIRKKLLFSNLKKRLVFSQVDKTLLFSHVPKTGGTAIMDFLDRIGGRIFMYNENNPINGILRCPTQHFEYKILDAIYDIDRIDYSFAVVRNPISRAKSDYLWANRNVPQDADIPSFDDWFKSIVKKYEVNPYILDNHIRPQSHFVGGKIKSVYRYEDGLEAALTDVLAKIGIRIQGAAGGLLQRQNTAEQHRSRESADVTASPETIDALYRFYEDDFRQFYPDAV